MVDRRRLEGDTRLRARELLDDPNGELEQPRDGRMKREKAQPMGALLAGRRWVDSDLLREGSRWRPAFKAAAACKEMDAERGDPVGDSERGTEETSPLAAMVGRFEDSIADTVDGLKARERMQLILPVVFDRRVKSGKGPPRLLLVFQGYLSGRQLSKVGRAGCAAKYRQIGLITVDSTAGEHGWSTCRGIKQKKKRRRRRRKQLRFF